MNILERVIYQPTRDYVLIGLLSLSLGQYYYPHFFGDGGYGEINFVLAAAILGSIMPLWGALKAFKERRVTIEAFNFFAIFVSFVTKEYTSAAFISLMLACAAWLDWKTEVRASNAVKELLRLKPSKAIRERIEVKETIDVEEIKEGDILIVENGAQVPVDGIIIYGTAFINEASLTGESKPVEKTIGDEVLSSTVSLSGIIKIKATRVGADSTLEQMARLIEEASKNKSKSEKLADKFAGIFLPIVLVLGALTYFITKDIKMTAALFLIVCADDIAVSIPLAMTASLGHAAKRGVIIKGGKWLQALAKANVIVFDKTGTLTYGTFALSFVALEPNIDEKTFWKMVAMAEKFSEHPVGRLLFKEASKKSGSVIHDPAEVNVSKGVGIWAKGEGHEIAIGNDKLAETFNLTLPEIALKKLKEKEHLAQTTVIVFLDGIFAGILGVADIPKEEAVRALNDLKKKGLRLVMLTGDNKEVAEVVAQKLGIEDYRALMTPESKLREIEELGKEGLVAMVGDGVNDAPALARANVGIAMGSGGTAVAVEAADVVILTDRIDRIGEMVDLSRRTVSVINTDIAIWVVTNIVGVALVFASIATPVFAALYNFLTDFIPLINSSRLFVRHPKYGAVIKVKPVHTLER